MAGRYEPHLLGFAADCCCDVLRGCGRSMAGNVRGLILVLLLLVACATGTPSPADCRWAGVDVPDGDPITGKIVAEYYAGEDGVTPEQVHKQCKGAPNCFRAVGFQNLVSITPKGEYVIWVSQPDMQIHERCHALYEETRHRTMK